MTLARSERAAGRKGKILGESRPAGTIRLEHRCATCGGPMEPGYVTTTNGSGLFWARQSAETRVRPDGLEVLVPTRFHGTYSANAQGLRCRACNTILLRVSPKDL